MGASRRIYKDHARTRDIVKVVGRNSNSWICVAVADFGLGPKVEVRVFNVMPDKRTVPTSAGVVVQTVDRIDELIEGLQIARDKLKGEGHP